MKTVQRGLAAGLIFAVMISLFCGCAQREPVKTANTREITDMAGRTVTVPAAEDITSVFSTDPVSAIFLYVTAPDKLLGWNYDLNEVEKSVILEKYHDIPNFGMGDAVNYEAVIAAGPHIALWCSSITEAVVSQCDDLSEKLGIPVVAVDSDLENSAAAFRFLGALLGEEEHCEDLAAYAEKTFADVTALEKMPEEDRVRIYYGNGEDSLETIPRGAEYGKVLDMICAVNVADLELGEGGRVQISAEQLLAWDPDVIILNGEPKADITGGSAAERILSDPDYASLKAVRDLKVYGIPNAPFGWVERPPGPNRIIGIRWLSALLYSDYLDCNEAEEVRESFELFYHTELSGEQLEQILNGEG